MKKPQGIGGWLLIPTISFMLAIFFCFLLFLMSIYSIVINDYTSLEIVTIILLPLYIPFLVYVLILEFKKRKEFKKWAIITLWISVVVVTTLSIFDGAYFDIIKEVIASTIWTLYFVKSKRVENTFTQ